MAEELSAKERVNSVAQRYLDAFDDCKAIHDQLCELDVQFVHCIRTKDPITNKSNSWLVHATQVHTSSLHLVIAHMFVACCA